MNKPKYTESVDKKPSEEPLSRRQILAGAVAAGLGIVAYRYREEIVVALDPEAAKAVKIREIYQKIEAAKLEIETALVDLGNTRSISAVNNVNKAMQPIISLLKEFKATEVKVNSGVVYAHLKRITAKLATVGFWEGLSGDVKSLINSAHALKNALIAISSPEITEFSNNSYINEKMGMTPRQHLVSGFSSMDDTEVPWVGIVVNFMEDYEFVLPVDRDSYTDCGGWNRKGGDLAAKLWQDFKKIRATMESFSANYQKKQTMNTHFHIQQFNRMLAIGGYLAFDDIDQTYGPKTHAAYMAFKHDLAQ